MLSDAVEAERTRSNPGDDSFSSAPALSKLLQVQVQDLKLSPREERRQAYKQQHPPPPMNVDPTDVDPFTLDSMQDHCDNHLREGIPAVLISVRSQAVRKHTMVGLQWNEFLKHFDKDSTMPVPNPFNREDVKSWQAYLVTGSPGAWHKNYLCSQNSTYKKSRFLYVASLEASRGEPQGLLLLAGLCNDWQASFPQASDGAALRAFVPTLLNSFAHRCEPGQSGLLATLALERALDRSAPHPRVALAILACNFAGRQELRLERLRKLACAGLKACKPNDRSRTAWNALVRQLDEDLSKRSGPQL